MLSTSTNPAIYLPFESLKSLKASSYLLLLEHVRDLKGALANELCIRGAKNSFWSLTSLYEPYSRTRFPMSFEGAMLSCKPSFHSKCIPDTDKQKEKALHKKILDVRFEIIR